MALYSLAPYFEYGAKKALPGQLKAAPLMKNCQYNLKNCIAFFLTANADRRP